ncbi:carbohydrate porin, partial [Ideonella azotifigens]|uniref:carbohydrate porin n=1 Tax=Ideonella azotifigens TaxID=513160 RepID=UPI001E5D02B9
MNRFETARRGAVPRALLSATAFAATTLLALPSAQALDWGGYFRAGPGLTSKNTSRACYDLKSDPTKNGGSAGMKYRLGNECDFYGEFALSQDFVKDGISSKIYVMTNHYNGGTDYDGSGVQFNQMYGEAKGFDIAPDATFWMGKAWGRRGDVHIVDTFFVDMVGVGAGARDFKAGPGKFGFAYYKADSDNDVLNRPGNRLNFEFYDIATNPGGKVNFYATATQGQFNGGTKGAGLTARVD